VFLFDQIIRKFTLLYIQCNWQIMDSQHIYTVEEVLEIALTLSADERKKIQEEIQKSLFDEKEILEKTAPFHQKFEATFKALA
jgi:hypothetical protein